MKSSLAGKVLTALVYTQIALCVGATATVVMRDREEVSKAAQDIASPMASASGIRL